MNKIDKILRGNPWIRGELRTLPNSYDGAFCENN